MNYDFIHNDVLQIDIIAEYIISIFFAFQVRFFMLTCQG
jgi:hypothetical protein